MLEEYSYGKQLLSDTKTKYRVYLQAQDQRVALEVQETLQGYHMAQVILRPLQPLVVGKEYTLTFDKITGSPQLPLVEPQSVVKYSQDNQPEAAKWTVVASRDLTPPSWISKPTELNKTHQEYGCGPARFVTYKIAVTEESQVLVRTSLTNVETGQTAVYLIMPEQGQLKVGHGMCAGAFAFQAGREYQVDFTLVDASGNQTPWADKKLRLIKPISSTE